LPSDASSTALRIGLCGVGRVYERLYAPAFARLPGLAVVAAADPSPERRAVAPGAAPFETVEEMLSAGGLDGVVVLSPPRLHHEQTYAVLRAGLPVLVEKPPASRTAELESWLAEGGAERVSVSLSRRYWRPYRALKLRLRPVQEIRLVLITRPGEWGPVDRRAEDPALDLLPHLVDMTRWLTGVRAAAVHAGGGRPAGTLGLELADGRVVECVAGHGEAYEEYAVVDGQRIAVGPPSTLESLVRRVTRVGQEEHRGFFQMLTRWEERLRGGSGRGLAGFRDAWANVAALEAYTALVGSGGGRLELPRAPAG